MTLEMLIVLTMLAIAVVLSITEWVRMEVCGFAWRRASRRSALRLHEHDQYGLVKGPQP